MIFSRYTQSLAAEVTWLRSQLEKAHERIDRLTEALARKNELNLVMPQTPLPKFETRPAKEIEKGSGWFDTRPIPPLAPKISGGHNK